MVLDFRINKKDKKKHNIKNKKLNCSLHTKKTNNTNKLMQISYYSTFTKIQKLQNWKEKKKSYFSIGQYAWYRPKQTGKSLDY